MIKFINWFIRPLGYVCVKHVHLDSYMDDSFAYRQQNQMNLLKSPSILDSQHYMFIGFDYAKEEKPEYKDNVVRFDKYV